MPREAQKLLDEAASRACHTVTIVVGSVLGLSYNACHSHPKTAERLSACSRNVRNFNDSGFWVCFRCYDMHNTLECTEIHKRMSLYIVIIYVKRILQEDDYWGTLHWTGSV